MATRVRSDAWEDECIIRQYDVRVLKREPEEVVPEAPCEVCDRTGVGVDDEDCAACGGLGEIEDYVGARYETPDEVGFREDLTPHYNRGRTRIAGPIRPRIWYHVRYD